MPNGLKRTPKIIESKFVTVLHTNNMQIKYDEQDAKVYRAMIELGWIIPATEEEIKWFDEANKDFEPPPFDFDKCLEEIKEKILCKKNL